MAYDLSSLVSNTTSLKLILEVCWMRLWIVFNWPREGPSGGSHQAENPVNGEMKYQTFKKTIHACCPLSVKFCLHWQNFPVFHVFWDERNHLVFVDLFTLYISANVKLWFLISISIGTFRISVYVHLLILDIRPMIEVWVFYSARLESRNSLWVYSRPWDEGIWWEISQQLGHREIEAEAPVNSMLQFEKLVSRRTFETTLYPEYGEMKWINF